MAKIPLVQNFSLQGDVIRKFAVDWSADNKIAVCTSKSIYIMNSYCSPVEVGFPLPLHKQVILVPDQPMQLNPIYIPPNPYQYIKTNKDRESLYQVLMDHTLNPTPPERAEAFRSFRTCKWSPKGAAGIGRCFLATLTMDHRLALYEEMEKEWKCICDLTELMKKEIVPGQSKVEFEAKQNKANRKRKKLRESRSRSKGKKQIILDDTDDEDEDCEEEPFEILKSLNFEELKKETYKFAPMEITWTGMFGGPATAIGDKSHEFCFLIVAMKSGHIQFWKVSSNEGRTLSLAYECDMALGMITSLCWQQTSSTAGFLMVGSLKGLLAFLPVSVVMADEELTINVKNLCKVWDEEDLMAVDQIAVLKIALRKYICIAAKMQALVGCEILLTEDSIMIRNVGHSFGLHNLPVTGMAVIDQKSIPQYKVLIATMGGMLVEVKVSLGEEEIKFQHDRLSIDLDLKNNVIQGLALSTNGLLGGVILKTGVYYDHLVKKEPLQFAMFVTKPFEEIYSKLKNVLKPQYSFLNTDSNAITNYTDYLDIIRMNLAAGVPLPDWLTAFTTTAIQSFDNSHSTLELYFMRYIVHAYVSGLAVSAPKDKECFEEKMSEIDALIMRRYISKVINSCKDNLDLLSPGQAQSLLLMADWLYKKFDTALDFLYAAFGCDVPTDRESIPPRETCGICKEDVKLGDLKVAQCPKGHEFTRCCLSLLLCDVVPYNHCPACKSVMLKDIWNFEPYCTYCGMMTI